MADLGDLHDLTGTSARTGRAPTARSLVVLRHGLVAIAAGAVGWFSANEQWIAVVAALAAMTVVVYLLPIRRSGGPPS